MAACAGSKRAGDLEGCRLRPGVAGTAALAFIDGEGSVRDSCGGLSKELDVRLSNDLDRFYSECTAGITPQRELTVEICDNEGALVAGLSGWTWGTCAGIGMLWVDEAKGRTGLGTRLLTAFEQAAQARNCVQVYVSSFTFQGPEFYERNGYIEFARQEGLPQPPHADVHLRKVLHRP